MYMALEENRIQWVDMAKGTGIMLVVAGHLCWFVTNDRFYVHLRDAINLFHMPLFFFISGFLYKRKHDMKELVYSRFSQLMIPYFSFLLAVSPFFLYSHYQPGNIIYLLKDIILGGTHLRDELIAFWFIPVMFFTQLIYSFFDRKLTTWKLHIAILITLLLSYMLYIRPAYYILPNITFVFTKYADSLFYGAPLAIQLCLGALPFYHAGRMYATGKYREKALPVTVLALAAIASTYFFPDNTNNFYAEYFGYPVISFIGAIVVILFVKQVLQRLTRIPAIAGILSSFGRNSLTIMCLHLLLLLNIKTLFPNMPLITFVLALGSSYAFSLLFDKSGLHPPCLKETDSVCNGCG
jgi:fucose 4-O-acetylase-like acetyltransferase